MALPTFRIRRITRFTFGRGSQPVQPFFSMVLLVCDSGGEKVPSDLEAVNQSAISNGSKILIGLKTDENRDPILIGFQTDENWRIHVF